MLAPRIRRRPTIDPILCQRLGFVGYWLTAHGLMKLILLGPQPKRHGRPVGKSISYLNTQFGRG